MHDCNYHDHVVVYRGSGNEVLCFACAIKQASLEGAHIETEIETEQYFRACQFCGR